MMDTWVPWQRRALALGILALGLCTLWLAVLSPIIEHFATLSDERESALRALSRDRALATDAPRIDGTLKSVEQNPLWNRLYDTQKPDQAALQLETDLRALFKSPNALTSMTAQPPAAQGALTRVSVKVTLTMPIDQWAESLGRMQSHSRLLQIESLTIQAPDFQGVDTNPALSIQATITAFMAGKGRRT